MIKYIISATIAAIAVSFIILPFAYSADWLYFIENKGGDRYYLDMESVEEISPLIFRLSRKVEPAHASDMSFLVSDIVIDCQGRRLKSLQETAYLKNGTNITEKKDAAFQNITVEDIDESLMELVCSLKKIR